MKKNNPPKLETLQNIIQEKEEKIQHYIQVNNDFNNLLQNYFQKNENLKQENSNLKSLIEQNRDSFRQLQQENNTLNEKNKIQFQEILNLNQEIETYKTKIEGLEQLLKQSTQDIKITDNELSQEDSIKEIQTSLQGLFFKEPNISKENCILMLKSQIIDNSRQFENVFLSQAYNDQLKQCHSELMQQGPDKEFQRYISGIRTNTQKDLCNLFESFYIIGFNKEQLITKIAQDWNLKHMYCTPFIQYEYKSNQSTQINQDLIMSLCQTSGNLVSYLSQNQSFQDDLLLDIIVGQTNEQKLSEKFHFCAIKQDQQLNFQNQELIDAYNPQGQLFFLCMTLEDFIVLDNQLWKYFKTFCFITYFPMIELFQKLLTYLINQQKYIRIEQLKNLDYYAEIDGFKVIEKNTEIYTENIRLNLIITQLKSL